MGCARTATMLKEEPRELTSVLIKSEFSMLKEYAKIAT